MYFNTYLTLKALHLLAVIAWMAGLLYLPRLFIYHLDFEVNSKTYVTFCTMERRLLKIIMLPSLLLTFLLGTLLAFESNTWEAPWFHIKLILVVFLAGFHGYLSKVAKAFARGEYPKLSRKQLSVLNEIPFITAIFIVFLAVLKPF
ncbi:MAG: CopD family protein [Proteobacteria bacterium]|nr:CopD family protein [Pseudomonadota bacterium]